MSGSGQHHPPRPVPVARASVAWDDLAPRERTAPVLPAACVRTRIVTERTALHERFKLVAVDGAAVDSPHGWRGRDLKWLGVAVSTEGSGLIAAAGAP